MPCWERGGAKGRDGRTIGFQPVGTNGASTQVTPGRKFAANPNEDVTSWITKAGMTRLVQSRSKSTHRPPRISRAISGSARNQSTILYRTMRRAHNPETSQNDSIRRHTFIRTTPPILRQHVCHNRTQPTLFPDQIESCVGVDRALIEDYLGPGAIEALLVT